MAREQREQHVQRPDCERARHTGDERDSVEAHEGPLQLRDFKHESVMVKLLLLLLLFLLKKKKFWSPVDIGLEFVMIKSVEAI